MCLFWSTNASSKVDEIIIIILQQQKQATRSTLDQVQISSCSIYLIYLDFVHKMQGLQL